MKQTLEQAGYTFIKKTNDGEYLLLNEDNEVEVFGKNKNHAGWGLIFRNTHLEFTHSLPNLEANGKN
tara:strand:- start:451 stop:651 length:201 start_codon:yes stop_codon:yes gene_type:complete